MTRRTEKKSNAESRRLKVWRFVAFLFLTFNCGLSTSPAATKVFLHQTSSKLGNGNGVVSSRFKFWLADATQGSSKKPVVISSIAGLLTGHYWPIPTTGYIMTDAGGSSWWLTWASPPLSAGVTISGIITPNLWGLESAAQCNCGARYEVLRWSVAAGGIISSLGISTDNGVTEWGTSAAVRTAPTLTPTSTAFAAGDRIVIVVYNDDGNGVTEASGRSWTLDYDAATGVDGDTYLSFTETLSFSADSNNARPLPMSSRAIIPTLSLLLRPAEEWNF
jgi:hypothetical protein